MRHTWEAYGDGRLYGDERLMGTCGTSLKILSLQDIRKVINILETIKTEIVLLIVYQILAKRFQNQERVIFHM